VHPTQIVFDLYRKYSPGGVEEKEALLKAVNEFPTCTTATTAVEELQNWDKRKRRMEALGIALPDASVALKKISS
jgi:hypothetical protein